MRKLVLGSIAFIMSLFSFTMCFYSLTPAFKILHSSANDVMQNASLPTGIMTIWNRTYAFYGYLWPAWGALGVVFLLIWLLVYLQKEDPYSYYVGGPRQ